MVLAQWLLLTQEVRSSNPIIGKILFKEQYRNYIQKTKIRQKKPEMAQF